MINGKKIIGLCMAQIHNTTRSRTVAYLHSEARKRGYNIIVFNNPFDFKSSADNFGAAADIYDLINFNIIDGLIILCSCFLDKSIYRKIIDRASANGVPVVLEDDTAENCITVRNSFEETFEKLMNHVIKNHGIRDTFFIAGLRGNEYSERRIEVYKKVLRDNGIEFSDDMVDYGDFWHGPTYGVIDRLISSGRKLPKAIFCANDAMAIAACEKLQKRGIKVPDDIIVTGLDGSKLAEFTLPKLSTCTADQKGFAEKVMTALNNAFEGRPNESVIDNYYSLRLAASCGCADEDKTDFREIAEDNYQTTVNLIGHEHYVFNQIMSTMNTDDFDMNTFYGAISDIMHESSLFALNPSFFFKREKTSDKKLSDILISITSGKLFAGEAQPKKSFNTSDMVPEKEKWAASDCLYIINQVHVGKSICGYYECMADNIVLTAQIMNRVLNLINMIVHMAVSDLRQRISKLDRGTEALIDPITELANLHGATHWFEKFYAESENKLMSLSIYEIPKYKYIYEEYGLKEVEKMLCFVAESLKIANPHNSFVARIAENEFVVINWYNNMDEIAPTIDSATTVFYGLIEQYNRTNGKDYYTEVNAGCTNVKDAKLETCIFEATNELYRNKLIYGTRTALKTDFATSKEKYERFVSLIRNNLFMYHFQPVVSAKTGEIYAYEALMRTDSSIGFNPIEVISVAAEYQRLYDIEKATLFNVMERYKKDREHFTGKKVFINCIPGHFLNKEDNRKLSELYSEYIDNFVFEITEQNTITDAELDNIRHIANPKGTNPIAVDDYGTGHSNVVNLIKYSPEIVKIDRFLMTDIHKDETKQLFVQNVIDFARLNNIKVLAEGIETSDELRKVIEMGVDFIQGYYTGRPVYEPISEIAPEIKEEILIAASERERREMMKNFNAELSDEECFIKLVEKFRANGVTTEQIINRVKLI